MITLQDLSLVRDKAKSIKALVIGDAMLDRYILGVVERMSPEAPVPILTHQQTINKAGGAANVALNLKAWGCETSIIGMIGSDPNGEELKRILAQEEIKHQFVISEGRPTTLKTRIVASAHQLLRIDEESAIYLTKEEETRSINHIIDVLNKETPSLIILQDYNKGFLTSGVISAIIRYSTDNKIYVAVDPKEKNFHSYHQADLFKPNLREAERAADRNFSIDELPLLATEWSESMSVETIAITLGGQGIYLHNQDHNIHLLPSRSVEVIDVCGAGDAVICALSLARLSGLNLEKSGELANLIGAYVCSHSGVVAVNPDEIQDWL